MQYWDLTLMQNSFVTLFTVNIRQTFFQLGKHCIRYPLTVRRNLPALPACWLDVSTWSDGILLAETVSVFNHSTTIAHIMMRGEREKTDILLAGRWSFFRLKIFWFRCWTSSVFWKSSDFAVEQAVYSLALLRTLPSTDVSGRFYTLQDPIRDVGKKLW